MNIDKINIQFSASSLEQFLRCKALYNYSHNKRKTVQLVHKAAALDFGGLAHKGLEVYFNELKEGKHYNDRMQATLMKIRESACDTNQSTIDIEKELPVILGAVEQSCEFWRFEDEQLEILGVEIPFDYILFEDDYLRVIISGKIDLLANIPSIAGSAEYKNLPLDHKTKSRSFPVDSLNDQFENYCVATSSNYLIVNEIGLQKTLKAEEKFKRHPISYDPAMLQEWKDDTTDLIINEYLENVKRDKWPKNRTSCRKFGRLCEFYEVCAASGQEAKDWKLESLFVDKEQWDKYTEGDKAE